MSCIRDTLSAQPRLDSKKATQARKISAHTLQWEHSRAPLKRPQFWCALLLLSRLVLRSIAGLWPVVSGWDTEARSSLRLRCLQNILGLFGLSLEGETLNVRVGCAHRCRGAWVER